jgi:murein L,D-transpeptidase YcbB/YkuD
MKTSHFHALLVFLIIIFIALGYWSYSVINIDFDAASTPVAPVVEKTVLENPATTAQPAAETPVIAPAASSSIMPTKYTAIASKLQALIKDNITMKSISRGTRVATVEEFITIYTGKNTSIKKLYTKDLETEISAFQTKSGIPATGFADPITYQKMIDWLKQ